MTVTTALATARKAVTAASMAVAMATALTTVTAGTGAAAVKRWWQQQWQQVQTTIIYENCCAMTFGGDYSGLYVFSLFCSPLQKTRRT